jgi:thiamine-phosphate pyrophosphorylase
MLQVREKKKSFEELSMLGKELSKQCGAHNVLFIVNDDPILAKVVGADGVHIGQEDLVTWPLERIRSLLGSDKIIGLSTHSLSQVKEAASYDVNYISYGPVIPTLTKDYCIGIQDVSAVLAMTAKPVVFIGGITLDNMGALLEKGAKNVAMIRTITQAEDVTARVIEIKNRMTKVDAKMKIRLNGKDEMLDNGSTIQDLVTRRGLRSDGLVVEHNANLIPREKWALTYVKENDTIETISFVGGG